MNASSDSNTADFVIIGAGIVGCATALELQSRYPSAKITIIEKADHAAAHQSGHNSGVIHAGVYYAPGSMKARFCREGLRETEAFCKAHNIPFHRTGKLIVATSDDEIERLDALHSRAAQNQIAIEPVDETEIRQLEPNINGVKALLSPTTGIVDYAAITRKYAALFVDRGGDIRYQCRLINGIETDSGVKITLENHSNKTLQSLEADYLISCAGLHSDRVIKSFGITPDYQVVPFRGEYFRLQNQPDDLINHLIYPVPDPQRPFLGVHLTRKMNGGFTVGPNAVLAFKREGYQLTDFSPKDLNESLQYGGFWKLLKNNASSAISELSASASKRLYLKRVQKYCPRITLSDFSHYPAGVRAQAVKSNGDLIDDFHFFKTARALHVGNAPSPAATSIQPIARYIADELSKMLN